MTIKLKSTGLALRVKTAVIASEGQVLLLGGGSATVHGNVTFSAATWNGVNREYFETKGSGYDAYGVQLSGNPPSTSEDGLSVFVAMAGMGTGSNARLLVGFESGTNGIKRSTTGKMLIANGSSGSDTYGETVVPSDMSTAFALGAYHNPTVVAKMYFGLEGNSLVLDGTNTPALYLVNPRRIGTIGGLSGQGYLQGKFHVVVHFDGEVTANEFASLGADWFDILFEDDAPAPSESISVTPGTSSVVNGGSRVFTITRSVKAPAGGLNYSIIRGTPAVAAGPSTVKMSEGSKTVTFTLVGSSVGSTSVKVTHPSDNAETATSTLTVTTATTKKFKLLTVGACAGATMVVGDVFALPSTGLTGTRLGFFIHKTFDTTKEGQAAVLQFEASQVGASELVTGTQVVVVWRGLAGPGSALGEGAAIGSGATQLATIVEE